MISTSYFWTAPKRLPMSLTAETAARLAKIKVVLCDVDGTLTDGGMYYLGDGGEAKKFSVRDGAGVALLRRAGIAVVFVSGESHRSIAARAEKLKIDGCFSGVRDKVGTVDGWLKQRGLDWQQAACVTDEINDIPLIRQCGFSFAVSDANPLVQREVDHVLNTPGGCGALRESAAIILDSRGLLDDCLQKYVDDLGSTPRSSDA
jgi:YrbI family 3-deoxy-D-manno-octulosonate 8-phosphate phosphatase